MSLRGPLLAVLVLTALAHASTLGGGFVYDDHRFVEFNDAVHEVRPADYFVDAATASDSEGIVADIYRPVRTLFFSLEWAVFGSSPSGWHLVSLLLHLLGTALAFRLLRGLLPEHPWACAAVAYKAEPIISASIPMNALRIRSLLEVRLTAQVVRPSLGGGYIVIIPARNRQAPEVQCPM